MMQKKTTLLLAQLLLFLHLASCSKHLNYQSLSGDCSDARFYFTYETWQIWQEQDSWPHYATYRLNTTLVALNDFTISTQRDTDYIFYRFPQESEEVLPFQEVSLVHGDSVVLSITYRLSRVEAFWNMKMRYFYDSYDRWIYGQWEFVYKGVCPHYVNKCIVH